MPIKKILLLYIALFILVFISHLFADLAAHSLQAIKSNGVVKCTIVDNK